MKNNFSGAMGLLPVLVVLVSLSAHGSGLHTGIGAIPHCAHALGTVAVSAPGKDLWWKKYGFAPPVILMDKIVRLSGCFRIADSDGTRDYVLIPDIGRHQVTGEHVTMMQEDISEMGADVRLQLMSTRTPGAEIIITGHGENSALRYGTGGGLEIFSGTQPDDTGYARTITGQVVALGFIRAYAGLIRQMSSMGAGKP